MIEELTQNYGCLFEDELLKEIEVIGVAKELKFLILGLIDCLVKKEKQMLL